MAELKTRLVEIRQKIQPGKLAQACDYALGQVKPVGRVFEGRTLRRSDNNYAKAPFDHSRT